MFQTARVLECFYMCFQIGECLGSKRNRPSGSYKERSIWVPNEAWSVSLSRRFPFAEGRGQRSQVQGKRAELGSAACGGMAWGPWLWRWLWGVRIAAMTGAAPCVQSWRQLRVLRSTGNGAGGVRSHFSEGKAWRLRRSQTGNETWGKQRLTRHCRGRHALGEGLGQMANPNYNNFLSSSSTFHFTDCICNLTSPPPKVKPCSYYHDLFLLLGKLKQRKHPNLLHSLEPSDSVLEWRTWEVSLDGSECLEYLKFIFIWY